MALIPTLQEAEVGKAAEFKISLASVTSFGPARATHVLNNVQIPSIITDM